MSRLIRSVLLCAAAVLAVGCTTKPVENIDQSLPPDSNRTSVQVM